MSTRGMRLVEAMKIRGMQKQHALAYALGVNESTVTRWKNNGCMSLESAIALCNVLDISLDWFLIGNGSMDRRKITNSYATMANTSDAKSDESLLYALYKFDSVMPEPSKALLIAFINSMLSR